MLLVVLPGLKMTEDLAAHSHWSLEGRTTLTPCPVKIDVEHHAPNAMQ